MNIPPISSINLAAARYMQNSRATTPARMPGHKPLSDVKALPQVSASDLNAAVEVTLSNEARILAAANPNRCINE